MRRRILISLIIVVASIGAAVGLYWMHDMQDTPLRVAFVAEMQPEIGTLMLQGAQLALTQYQENATGGTLPVELVTVDVTSETRGEVQGTVQQAVTDLVAQEDVVAAIDATRSEYVQHALRIYNEAGIPVITPGATWPGLTKFGYAPGEPAIYYPTGTRNLFRTITADDAQGLFAAQWLQTQGIESVYLLTLADDVYSEGVAGILAANAQDYNIETVGDSAYDLDVPLDAQIGAIADDIVDSGAQAVYVPLVANVDGSAIVGQLQARVPGLLILSSEGLLNDPPETAAQREGMVGVYATSLAPNPLGLDKAAAFAAQYEQTFGVPAPPYALTSHDAMLALLLALEQAAADPTLDDEHPTRQTTLRALQNLGTVDGAMGEWTFDDNGDTTLIVVTLQQYQEDGWQVLDSVSIDTR